MPYYDTLAEDLTRAKEILAKGSAKIDFADAFPAATQADRERILEHAGGTIYGADIYAAYKLLESFVAEIEKRTLVQGHCGSCGGINFTVVETCINCGESEQLEQRTGTAQPRHIPGCTCIIVNGEYRSTEVAGCPVHPPGTRRTSITCPRCGWTSHNLNDVRQRYCGNCRSFHDELPHRP